MTDFQHPQSKHFEASIDGKNTHLLSLQNRSGMQVYLTDYGARIVSILVPDQFGNLVDVALGFDSLAKYQQADEQYHGASIGRFANRIAQGQFSLDGQRFQLAQNNGSNSLHGGPNGFHTKVWDRQVSFKNRIDFYYVSPAGEEGFPGTLTVNIAYELSEDNEISIKYKAESDEKTIVNLSNHTYFNLNGEGRGDILNHILTLPATHFLPIDEKLIPFGFEAMVDGSAFDFREGKKIGQEIGNPEEQLQRANGYDHTYVNHQPLSQPAAGVLGKSSGIQLEVFTSEPGIHLYTGNALSGKDIGKSGLSYPARTGFCLETQHYPDSPNQPNFPTVILEPGETYTSETRYKFSIKKEA